MDLVKFFNDLTDEHLLGWKVALATLVMAQAGLQVALAARFWTGSGLPLHPATAGPLHRWNGRALLVESLVLAFVCLWTQAGPTNPARILIHTIVGSTLLALLTAKIALVRLTERGQARLPVIGIALFVNYVVIWITSVYDFATVDRPAYGSSGALQVWVLITGVLAAALGALGIVGFLRRRPAPVAAEAA